MAMDDNLLTKKQVSELLKCTPDTVRRLVIKHNIPAVRVSHKLVLYQKSAILKLLEARTTLGKIER